MQILSGPALALFLCLIPSLWFKSVRFSKLRSENRFTRFHYKRFFVFKWKGHFSSPHREKSPYNPGNLWLGISLVGSAIYAERIKELCHLLTEYISKCTQCISGFYPKLVSPRNRQVVKALSKILGPLALSRVEPDATEFSFSHQYSYKVAAPASQAQHLHWMFVRC